MDVGALILVVSQQEELRGYPGAGVRLQGWLRAVGKQSVEGLERGIEI